MPWKPVLGRPRFAGVGPAQKASEGGGGGGDGSRLFHFKKGWGEIWSELEPWGQPLSGPKEVLKALGSGEDQKPDPAGASERSEVEWRVWLEDQGHLVLGGPGGTLSLQSGRVDPGFQLGMERGWLRLFGEHPSRPLKGLSLV